MKDAALMGVGDGVADLGEELEAVAQRTGRIGCGMRDVVCRSRIGGHRPFIDGLAVDPFHQEDRLAVDGVGAQDGDDAWVGEGGSRLNLALEAGAGRDPGKRPRGQTLDGDDPLSARLDGLEYRALGAAPDFGEEGIWAERAKARGRGGVADHREPLLVGAVKAERGAEGGRGRN